ncbi:MAG: cell wall hydrolase [Bacteroidales bacterium]
MTVLAEAVLIMTMNIYHESRGESLAGQQAVADTAITRVHDARWPNSVHDVVLQPKQFSWVKEKKVKTVFDLMALQDAILHSKKTTPRQIEAYRKAEKLARKVLQEGYQPRYKFTHFHATKILPYWARYRGVWIGNHVFYRIPKK